MIEIIQVQIISNILQTKSLDIIENNMLNEEYFLGYENEYNFIIEHNEKYGSVPDKATFLSNFPDFELVQVEESDKYLVDKIREQYLYNKSVPIVQRVAELLKTDANAASEYMLSAVKTLTPNYDIGGVDIIAQADDRYNEYMDRKNHQDEWFFTSGLPELDDVIHGIQRKEEFFVIVARTNQGKSWMLEKIAAHIWEIGFNVGYVSPEMGASSIGFRFDTLHEHFSNTDLMWGKTGKLDKEYKAYIDNLKSRDNKFIVSTPNDFGNSITIKKLRMWIKKYKLDMIAIDGISYLSDERAKRGDNLTTALKNISEDLMALSMEMNIPILVVVQANRSGANNSESTDVPELESIRDSDGIAYNASKVVALRQTKDGLLTLQIKKQRNGRVGDKLQYMWNPDIGEFIYQENVESNPINREQVVIKKHTNKEDCF